jgi:hypothetical protein
MTIEQLIEHMRRDAAFWDKVQDDFLRYRALLALGRTKAAEELNWRQQGEQLHRMETLAGRMLTGSELDQIDAALKDVAVAILGPKKTG